MSTTTTTRIALRDSTAADASFIHAVIEATMRAHVEATWGAWSSERVRAESEADAIDSLTRIIRLDRRDCGVFHLEQRETEFWIQMLFVLPAFQRKGIGAHLLSNVFDAAARVRLPVRLRVMRVNPARHYYERLGFRRFEEDRDFLYFERHA